MTRHRAQGATDRNTLQLTATHYMRHYPISASFLLWHAILHKVQHIAIHCNTLQHTATPLYHQYPVSVSFLIVSASVHKVQHTATHYNTLQYAESSHCTAPCTRKTCSKICEKRKGIQNHKPGAI